MPTWKFYGDGRIVEIEPERWRWEAHYLDGSVLKQFDDDGVFHQFREIQQDRLSSFWMVNDVAPPIAITWNPDYKLIHFYRGYMVFDGFDNSTYRLYCFGYQTADCKHIMVIMPDDSVFVTDDVDKIKVV
jgi:hypothetical protein